MLGDISSAPDFSWLRKQWVTIKTDLLVNILPTIKLSGVVFFLFFECKNLNNCIGVDEKFLTVINYFYTRFLWNKEKLVNLKLMRTMK